MAMGTNVGAASAAEAAELYGRDTRDRHGSRRLALAARSLSLELARQRHRLASQLVNAIVYKIQNNNIIINKCSIYTMLWYDTLEVDKLTQNIKC